LSLYAFRKSPDDPSKTLVNSMGVENSIWDNFFSSFKRCQVLWTLTGFTETRPDSVQIAFFTSEIATV
jgi:hypothetical protein